MASLRHLYINYRERNEHQNFAFWLLHFALRSFRTKWGTTIRLACLIHAASVHPGPGSNPLIKNIAIRHSNERGWQYSRKWSGINEKNSSLHVVWNFQRTSSVKNTPASRLFRFGKKSGADAPDLIHLYASVQCIIHYTQVVKNVKNRTICQENGFVPYTLAKKQYIPYTTERHFLILLWQ